MVRLILACVLIAASTGTVVAQEPTGPTTPVPPVPTATEIDRALLTRFMELAIQKSKLIAEANEIGQFLLAYEWVIETLEDGDFKTFLIAACNQSRLRLAAIEIEIAIINADMQRIRYLLGW